MFKRYFWLGIYENITNVLGAKPRPILHLIVRAYIMKIDHTHCCTFNPSQKYAFLVHIMRCFILMSIL